MADFEAELGTAKSKLYDIGERSLKLYSEVLNARSDEDRSPIATEAAETLASLSLTLRSVKGVNIEYLAANAILEAKINLDRPRCEEQKKELVRIEGEEAVVTASVAHVTSRIEDCTLECERGRSNIKKLGQDIDALAAKYEEALAARAQETGTRTLRRRTSSAENLDVPLEFLMQGINRDVFDILLSLCLRCDTLSTCLAEVISNGFAAKKYQFESPGLDKFKLFALLKELGKLLKEEILHKCQEIMIGLFNEGEATSLEQFLQFLHHDLFHGQGINVKRAKSLGLLLLYMIELYDIEDEALFCFPKGDWKKFYKEMAKFTISNPLRVKWHAVAATEYHVLAVTTQFWLHKTGIFVDPGPCLSKEYNFVLSAKVAAAFELGDPSLSLDWT